MFNKKLFGSLKSLSEKPVLRRIVFIVILVHMVSNPWAFFCSSDKLIKAIEEQATERKADLMEVNQNKKAVAKVFLEKVNTKEEADLLKEIAEIKE